MASASPDSDFRILLIGRTGHGKSSTGNTIVGKDIFKVSEASKSLTKTCQWSKKFKRFGKIVEVVDTPGIFDTDSDVSDVQKELLKALALTTPGFHVIAFVLMKGRFTEEIQKTQDLFFEWFGPGVEKFACVILTDTDTEEAKEKYIYEDPHEKLAHLVNTCGKRVVALNNLASNEVKESQVRRLFEVVERVKHINENEHFTNVAFQLAVSYAMNKCPRELSMDSILILQRAGLRMVLSENQCRYLDNIFTLSHEDARSQPDEYDAVANTGMEETAPPTTANSEMSDGMGENTSGNLQIFDNSTNERIRNTQKVQRPVQQPEMKDETSIFPSSSLTGTVPDTLSDSLCSQTAPASGITDTQSNRNNLEASAMPESVSVRTDIDSISESQDLGSDQIDNLRKPSSRKGRRIDYDSVKYDIPESPVDEFKNKVNEENSEELHGLFGFLKKAWKFCKQKVRNCTLL